MGPQPHHSGWARKVGRRRDLRRANSGHQTRSGSSSTHGHRPPGRRLCRQGPLADAVRTRSVDSRATARTCTPRTTRVESDKEGRTSHKKARRRTGGSNWQRLQVWRGKPSEISSPRVGPCSATSRRAWEENKVFKEPRCRRPLVRGSREREGRVGGNASPTRLQSWERRRKRGRKGPPPPPPPPPPPRARPPRSNYEGQRGGFAAAQHR